MLRFGIFLLGMLAVWSIHANDDPAYIKVAARPGDGIFSLMRRYELDRHSCNFEKFYALNRLQRESHLMAGREYLLPIFLYTFNGRTIRSSIGINDWDLAVRIQEYNERMLALQTRDDNFRKSRVLWVPYHLLNCPEPDLKPLASPMETADGGERDEKGKTVEGGNRRFPIFGEKYAYTPLESTRLRGQVFYIVSGHGGPDPGAMGKRGGNTLCEDEYAYDVALRLCRYLIANGATAYMIVRDDDDGIRNGTILGCDYDEVLWGGIQMMRQVKPRLFQRSDVINELYEMHKKQGVTQQKLIIIHVDSRSHGEQIDLFFYHKPGSEESRQLAQQLHATMEQKYRQHRSSGTYHGSVSSRDLHMLRETQPTSVYIELGNIRNSFDQQRIVLESNRQALAKWLFEGLLK